MITPILLMAVAAWAAAQILKLVIASAYDRKFAWRYLSTGGGMPSSHSAMVCACATGVGFSQGLDDPLFAINVRWETGKQAKVLNCMMRSWSGEKPELLKKELKEMLGHTPFQVAMGALLGVAVGIVGSLIAF